MTTFIPNPAGIAEIAISPELGAVLGAMAEAGAETARAIAPKLTGAYANSIQSTFGIDGGVMTGRYYAEDFKANWLEFGTGEPAPTPAFAPLRRAMDSLGAI